MRKYLTAFFATLIMTTGFATSASAQVPGFFADFDNALEQSMGAVDQSMAAVEQGLAAIFGPRENFRTSWDNHYDNSWEYDGNTYYEDPYASQYVIEHDPYSIYTFLTEDERQIYDKIYPAIANAYPKAVIYSKVSGKALWNAIDAIRMDHPEFVWLNGFWNGNTYDYKRRGTRLEITFDYNDLVANPARYQREFYDKAEEILSEARQKPTKYEQAQYIYEYLVTQSVYEKHDLARTAYASIVMERAICVGFAMGMHYLLQQLDIPSYSVGSSTHEWVVARINERWVIIDATTPQDTEGYRLDSREKLEKNKNRNFNVEYDDFESQFDLSLFPNDRLFGE